MTSSTRRHVLYIEDNPVNVRLVGKVLRLRPGIVLSVAATGEDGLVAARSELPDLILLDWRLPGMQGAEVLRELTGTSPTDTIPVVVFSGDSGRDQVTDILRAGAAGFVPKPFEIDQLLSVVDTYCS